MEQSNFDTKVKEIINQKDIRIQQLEEQLLSIQQQNHTYICLKCNQLYTSIDIFNHLQQYKDHIDCCIHSDIIKNQLLEFNNNNISSYSNNNIFKNRIDTIWSELERLSESYSKLHKKKKEISNHFEKLHNQLMIKEHSLKKQINDDIDLISCDIINQINELKSISNIVNRNNNINNNNNNNNNKSEETYVALSDSEDTQDKYSITTIIESINKSKSYNQFISNNKNTLFYNNSNNNENDKEFITILNSINNYNKEFKSCLSNPNKVNTESFKLKIDKNKYIIKIDQYNRDQLYKLIDSSITVEILPSVLVRIGDFKGLKKYFKRNNIEVIDYKSKSFSHKQKDELYELVIEILESNRIDILKYLINNLNFDMNTYFEIRSTQINDFKRLYRKNILDLSVIYSNLETIKFIESLGIKNNIKWNYESALELSPLSNNMDILQYFSSKVLENSPDSIKKIFVSGNAALIGRTDMIEWISQNTPFLFKGDNFIKVTHTAMDVAAMNGHLETIKWLHENRTEGCTSYAMDNAAKNGHFEIINWLHENRTEGCTTEAMDNAAKNGHFEIVKWLHHNRTEGCTTHAMDFAPENGHFEIIKWLHENRTEGCTTEAMDFAACEGYFEIFKWLQENRTEGCTTEAMDCAAGNGFFEIVKWLHHNRTEGCTTHAMDCCAESNRLEMLKWLHENRTEGCTTYAMDSASSQGHFEIIKWLHENRTEGCTDEAMNNAAEKDYFEIFKWLYENRTECDIDSAMKFANERLLEWINNNKK